MSKCVYCGRKTETVPLIKATEENRPETAENIRGYDEIIAKCKKAKKEFRRRGLRANVWFDRIENLYKCEDETGFWTSFDCEMWTKKSDKETVKQKLEQKATGFDTEDRPYMTRFKIVETDEVVPKSVEERFSDFKKAEHIAQSEVTKASFIKADSGKLQWSLLPFNELKDVVKVLMLGAKKYSPDNWKKCDDTKRYKDALMRHVISYVSGNERDEESGLSHLAHAICNCLFLMWFDNQKGE